MKERKLPKVWLLLCGMTMLVYTGCKDSEGNHTPAPGYECGVNTIFKTTDFEVYNVEIEPSPDNSSVKTVFNVKNRTTKKYEPDNEENGEFVVYISMKASDGALYDYEYLLNSDMNAGASVTSHYTFGVPVAGMTLDPNSFTYEVKCRD